MEGQYTEKEHMRGNPDKEHHPEPADPACDTEASLPWTCYGKTKNDSRRNWPWVSCYWMWTRTKTIAFIIKEKSSLMMERCGDVSVVKIFTVTQILPGDIVSTFSEGAVG